MTRPRSTTCDFSVHQPMDYMDVSLDLPWAPLLLLPKAESDRGCELLSPCTLPLSFLEAALLRPACQPETSLPEKARRDP